MKAMVREYDDFKSRIAPHYTDSKSVLDEKKIKKLTKDDRLVPDIINLWSLCGKMRNILAKNVNALDKAETTAEEKDKLLNEEIKSLPGMIEKMIEEKITEALGSRGDKNRTTLYDKKTDTETYTLVVEEKTSDGTPQPFTPAKWSDIVRTSMSQKLEEIPVKKTLLTENGKAIMKFPALQSRETAAEALEDDFVIAKEVSKVQKLLPKIKICDLQYYKKEDSDKLKSDISKKNPTLKALVDGGATFDIIFIHESGNLSGYGYAVVKVDPRIREEIIKNQSRIYIGTTSFYVKDQIHVTQCFACQQFGHKRGSPHYRFFNTDKHLCLYCAKNNHLSKDCPSKGNRSKYNCVNCKNTRTYANFANHTSTSSICPIFAKEAESVIKRTACDSKNFPILRTIQRQF